MLSITLELNSKILFYFLRFQESVTLSCLIIHITNIYCMNMDNKYEIKKTKQYHNHDSKNWDSDCTILWSFLFSSILCHLDVSDFGGSCWIENVKKIKKIKNKHESSDAIQSLSLHNSSSAHRDVSRDLHTVRPLHVRQVNVPCSLFYSFIVLLGWDL